MSKLLESSLSALKAANPFRRRLTPAQRQLLECIVNGDNDHAIAARLGIAADVVAVDVAALLQRLGVATRTEATVYAIRHGLIPIQTNPNKHINYRIRIRGGR